MNRWDSPARAKVDHNLCLAQNGWNLVSGCTMYHSTLRRTSCDPIVDLRPDTSEDCAAEVAIQNWNTFFRLWHQLNARIGDEKYV